ncbi:MAG: Type phosphodiesterase/nucleotide pyrophosphatase, partial [Verrucomicrobiales bacterium]|nr:Type phosphodiesterase/nucleotide pyrophosphatase [Verrucomicrobiales bacterium]
MRFRNFVIAALLAASIAPARAQNMDVHSNIVVLVSVDGLAAYYFDDPKAEMPNIHALAAAGARAKSMKAVAPTVTWPNHTTLVTGVTPAVHGVVGNNYYDREKKEQITLIFDPVLDKEQIVKVPTIYDIAKLNGLTTAAFNWPGSRNAKNLDWTTPEVHKTDLYQRYTTPAVLDLCRDNGFSLVDEIFPSGVRKHENETDGVNLRVLKLIIANKHPNLALLHLGNPDHVQHDKGPKSQQAYAAIKEADERIGEIWKALQQDFPGRATIFVVSDHGFSPIKSIILPNVVLNKAGLVQVKGNKVTTGSVRFVSQAGAGLVYVLDDKNRKDVMKQVEKAFGHLKGISKVVHTGDLKKYGVGNPKDDPHAPDMVLFAEEGYTFGDTAGGDV